MTVTARFITDCREELYEVGTALAAAFDDAVLQDEKNPVLITVNGSYRSGKKIIMDSVRETFFGEVMARLYGSMGRDENWVGVRNGKTLELNFIDTLFIRHYTNPDISFKNYKTGLEKFLASRISGGVSIVQNAQDCEDTQTPSITVHIEHPSYTLKNGSARFPGAHDGVHAYFDHRANKEWLRYVEITVNDNRLLADNYATRAFSKVAPEAVVATSLDIGQAPVAVYPRYRVLFP